jgi:thiopurine S-methyltransferase
MSPSKQAPSADASHWDQLYQEGSDGWELGQPAPPLAQLLRCHPLAPQAPGRVLVPGCGRGHEVALLEALGFLAIGLDFSGEALREARRLHGEARDTLQWLQTSTRAFSAAGRG